MYRDLIKKADGSVVSPASTGGENEEAGQDTPCVVLCYGEAAAERARNAASGSVVPDMASSIELTALKAQLKRAQAERDEANENLAAVASDLGSAKMAAKGGDSQQVDGLMAELETVKTELKSERLKRAEMEINKLEATRVQSCAGRRDCVC